jgi:hypothetical protein
VKLAGSVGKFELDGLDSMHRAIHFRLIKAERLGFMKMHWLERPAEIRYSI